MALIPPFFLDCVVAIGIEDPENPRGERKWIASGFLYGHCTSDIKSEKKSYKIYLVTNQHVFEGLSTAYLRFNPRANEPARTYTLYLKSETGSLLWVPHPDKEIDVAVIPFPFTLLQAHNIQASYFGDDLHVANVDKLNELGVTEGDFVYVLGFPMGLIGGERNVVIVRGGTIARIKDILVGANQEYLIDSFVFPGNSGGPVIVKPEAISIEGTKSLTVAYLIGIVKGYIPYNDVAFSLQTKRPRVTFEENSGLTAVHPIDFVQEAIESHIKRAESTKEQQKPQT